ncbi:MAG: ABC transporter permease [Candidatus Moranbacteria bacterium]|nr:ABC transporter permease [Candidatus Moranbacteria bacterium]
MKISDPIKISYRSLTASKMRFFLTVLGIVIGVAAVIMVMAIGASAQQLVLAQVEKVGSHLIGILPGASEEDGPPAAAFGVVTTTFINDDLKALRERRNIPHLVAISGYVSGSATIESGAESLEVSYQGVSPDMIEVESIEVAEGRFFFPEEESNLARVIVLGAIRAKEFFPDRNPIGETVKVKDIPFRVVGVLKERGSTAFSNPDTLVFVPLETAQKLLLGIDYLNFARGKVDTSENVDRTVEDINILLRDRHDIEEGEEADFSVRNTASALEVLTRITNILKYFLTAIASISLVVGGVGIMNSMLIAVSQRIREIGLRKAVGARPQHILTQFLIESSFVTLLGGFLGIVLGITLSFLAAVIIPRLGYEWEFIVPISSLGIGFGVSFAIGIVFGLYPAFTAAKVSPMEALRYE